MAKNPQSRGLHDSFCRLQYTWCMSKLKSMDPCVITVSLLSFLVDYFEALLSIEVPSNSHR